jgi:hypothetical protein
MSNSRIFTTDGKSTSGTKYFGMTVKDRQSTTTPNMTQLTVIPASDTIQNHKFLLGGNETTADSGTTPALAAAATTTLTPDLTLLSTRCYQFSAYITMVLQTADGTFLSGHYLLTTAARGTSMIGSGAGYRLDTISSESGIDAFVDETAITLGVSGNKFVITVTATVDIDFSIDLLADITINSAIFTP